ncbi:MULTISPECIES: hypothetical protein [Sphingobacterium]|uniref:hypothetical protein n=1 Tax=Sphingobacterium TaxID=28453 RepID=UPI00257E7BBF|nr:MULTISPECIES: hypothetical protein [Sphingobacterium]
MKKVTGQEEKCAAGDALEFSVNLFVFERNSCIAVSQNTCDLLGVKINDIWGLAPEKIMEMLSPSMTLNWEEFSHKVYSNYAELYIGSIKINDKAYDIIAYGLKKRLYLEIRESTANIVYKDSSGTSTFSGSSSRCPVSLLIHDIKNSSASIQLAAQMILQNQNMPEEFKQKALVNIIRCSGMISEMVDKLSNKVVEECEK